MSAGGSLVQRLITAGVHPSEVYHIHYALLEDSIGADFQLATEFEQFIMDTCILKFCEKPARRIARAFFDYCQCYEVFEESNEQSDMDAIWYAFMKPADYVIGPHRYQKDATVPQPSEDRRRSHTQSLLLDLVPLLRAAAAPTKGQDFNVSQVVQHDFAEAMKDEYIYRALFMPALPAIAEQDAAVLEGSSRRSIVRAVRTASGTPRRAPCFSDDGRLNAKAQRFHPLRATPCTFKLELTLF